MLNLYYSPGACSLAPHILLEELGVPYRLQRVSVAAGETGSPEYLAINPKGRVPALVVDGQLLTEAPAILVYLSLTDPDRFFLPRALVGHFRCLEWLNWLSSTVHAIGYGQLWRPERFIEDRDRFTHVSAKGKRNILDAYRHVELLMTGRTWSVGDMYSCVDPYLFVFFIWGRMIGLDMNDYPSWSAHAGRVAARDAVRRAVQQEGIRQMLPVDA